MHDHNDHNPAMLDNAGRPVDLTRPALPGLIRLLLGIAIASLFAAAVSAVWF